MEVGWTIDRGASLCKVAYKIHEAMTDDIVGAPAQFLDLAKEVETFCKVFDELLDILKQHNRSIMISCSSIAFTIDKCRLFLNRFWKLRSVSTGSSRWRFKRSLLRAAQYTLIAQPAADRLRLELASHVRILTFYTSSANLRIALEERVENQEIRRMNMELVRHISSHSTPQTKSPDSFMLDQIPNTALVSGTSGSAAGIRRSSELEHYRRELEALRVFLGSEERRFHDSPNSIHDTGPSLAVDASGQTDAMDFIHLAREDIENQKERIRYWQKRVAGPMGRSIASDSGVGNLSPAPSPTIISINGAVCNNDSQGSPTISSLADGQYFSTSSLPPSPIFPTPLHAQGFGTLGLSTTSGNQASQAPRSTITSKSLAPMSRVSRLLFAYREQLSLLEKELTDNNEWENVAPCVTVSIKRRIEELGTSPGYLQLSRNTSRTKIRLIGKTSPADNDGILPPVYFQQTFCSHEIYPYPHVFHTGADLNRATTIRVIGATHRLQHLGKDVETRQESQIFYKFETVEHSKKFQEQIYGLKPKYRFNMNEIKTNLSEPILSTTLGVWEDPDSHIRSLTVFGQLANSEMQFCYGRDLPTLERNCNLFHTLPWTKRVRLKVLPRIGPSRRGSSSSESSMSVLVSRAAEEITWTEFKFDKDSDRSTFLALLADNG